MQHKIYNKQTGINYTLQGDYYFPDLILSFEEEKHNGIWGSGTQGILKNIIKYGMLTC